jgi:hypothetical protein
MKKLIIAILCFMSTLAFGDCDWTQIKQLPDGGYEYNAALNICVGQLVQDSKVKDQQIADLQKAITLKDLALTTADQRTMLWQKSSDDEMARLNTIQSDSKRSDWLYFGLGVLTTVAAGYMAAQIIRTK